MPKHWASTLFLSQIIKTCWAAESSWTVLPNHETRWWVSNSNEGCGPGGPRPPCHHLKFTVMVSKSLWPGDPVQSCLSDGVWGPGWKPHGVWDCAHWPASQSFKDGYSQKAGVLLIISMNRAHANSINTKTICNISPSEQLSPNPCLPIWWLLPRIMQKWE